MVLFLLPALYLPALQGEQFVQDRYLYLPSVGFAILLALGVRRLGLSRSHPPRRRTATVIAAVSLAAMALGTISQSRIWANNLALFTRAVQRAPQSRMAQHDLAAALVDSGRYDEAIGLLQALLGQEPNDAVDNNNLGQAYLKKGDREHAEVFLAKSCELRPSPGQFYQLGAVRFNLDRPEAAERAFRQAIAMDPRALGYHYALGLALEKRGDFRHAADEFKRELELNPADNRAQHEIARLEHQ